MAVCLLQVKGLAVIGSLCLWAYPATQLYCVVTVWDRTVRQIFVSLYRHLLQYLALSSCSGLSICMYQLLQVMVTIALQVVRTTLGKLVLTCVEWWLLSVQFYLPLTSRSLIFFCVGQSIFHYSCITQHCMKGISGEFYFFDSSVAQSTHHY